MSALHEVAVVQAVGAQQGDETASISRFATAMSRKQVQLFYQIALVGLRDLPLAPDPRCGFEMVMLRLLAFQAARGAWCRGADRTQRSEKKTNGQDGARAKRAADLPRPVDLPRSGPVSAARAPALGDDWYVTVRALELGGVAR